MKGGSAGDSGSPTDVIGTARILGLVTDVQGGRLANAIVHLGDKQVKSKKDGSFDLGQVPVGQRVTIVVELKGYASARARAEVLADQKNYVKIALQKQEVASLKDAQAGGMVETPSGVTLELPAGSVVDADGNAVTGPITVAIALLNDRDEIAAAPGGLIAANPDTTSGAAETPLESYGMVEVTLTAADGREVNLSGDMPASLTFPLALNNSFSTGETVPLWHFDEEENIWKMVGEGMVLADNTFQATVTHFSWWNADKVLTKTCILGHVLDASGKPIVAAQLTGEGRSYLGSSHATSDNDGGFCMEARVSSVIEVSTLVQIAGKQQALAVNVNTPRTTGSCGTPKTCFSIDDLVAIADTPLCDPAQCPQQSGKQACCKTDLGPCDFVVNGDCGGSADGSWDKPPTMPGVAPVPGVPMGEAPVDAGTGGDNGSGGSNAGNAGTGDGSGGTNAGSAGTNGGGGGANAGSGGTTGGSGGANAGSGGASGGDDAGSNGGSGGATAGSGGASGGLDAGSNGGSGGATAGSGGASGGDDAGSNGGTGGKNGGTGGASAGSGGASGDFDAGSNGGTGGKNGGTGGASAGTGGASGDFDAGTHGGTGGSGSLDGGNPTVTCSVSAGAQACSPGDTICGGSDVTMNCSDGHVYEWRRAFVNQQCEMHCYDNGHELAPTCSYAASTCGGVEQQPCQVDCGFPNFVFAPQDAGTGSGGMGGGSCPASMLLACDGVSCVDSLMLGNKQCNPSLDCSKWQFDMGDCSGQGMDGGVSDGGMPDGGGGNDGGGTWTPVDRCADVTPLQTLDPVLGTTVGSTLLNDWYDQASCNSYMPGYERVYSVKVPPGTSLRARAIGEGVGTVIASNCNDVVGSCVNAGSSPQFQNFSPTPQTAIVIVDNFNVDAQVPFTLYLSTGAPSCGDHFVDQGESCDDGNHVDGDGCNPSCQVDQGWVCTPDGSCHQVVCGDGIQEGKNGYAGGAYEACDDGNSNDNDGCSSQCDVEPGFVCEAPNQPCRPIVCGDGIIDTGYGNEQCDDGNAASSDGCSDTCRVEQGYACNGVPSSCAQRPSGDLCSNALALSEGDYSLSGMERDYFYGQGPDMLFVTSVPSGQLFTLHGTVQFDGYLSLMSASQCPGNTAGEFAVQAGVPFTWTVDTGNLFRDSPSSPPNPTSSDVIVMFSASQASPPNLAFTIDSFSATDPVCGDGWLTRRINENCDDGNANDNDGCSASCQPEPGYVCESSGQPCRKIVCGDGLVDWPEEDCEDGNMNTGDGCGTDCRTEAGFLCDWSKNQCVQRPAGDLCNNADVLPAAYDGVFDMVGMTADSIDCGGMCLPTRWFAVSQQPGDVTTVVIDGDFSGNLQFVAGYCPPSDMVGAATPDGNVSFGPGQSSRGSSTNQGGAPRTLWMRVAMTGSGGGNFHLKLRTGAPGCGDGIRDHNNNCPPGGPCVPTETCDDMNTVSNDGCSATCTIEAGYRCPDEGGPCTALACGDGFVDQQKNPTFEFCDDGNKNDLDGCSATCTIEAGWVCTDYQPQTCTKTIAGDVCENAVTLPLGHSEHTIDEFTADPQFGMNNNDPNEYGQSAWFVITLQPRERLSVHAVASYMGGRIELLGAGLHGCAERFYITDNYTDQGGFPVAAQNDGNQPLEVYAVVRTGKYQFTSGTFSLDVDVSVPQDCSMPGACVDVTCGDGLIRGDEQCDDGNTNGGDGCSASCVAEPTHLCSGEPSTCVPVLSGDRCDGALPLVDGPYSLAGYTPEPTCSGGVCGGASRWFSIDVPAWQTLRVTISSTDMQGGFGAISGDMPCWTGASFGPGGGGGPSQGFGAGLAPATQAFVNATPMARVIMIAVWDQLPTSNGSFTISHSMQPTGCGDAYFDQMGQFGAPESCDDGNHATGDGCDGSCHAEQGWECPNGVCRPIQCGDGIVSQGETCDDSNTNDADGCSATCQIERGYLCGGNPYTCQTYQQGDMCSNALQLQNGTFTLDGYLADLSCHDICGGSDRWFTFTVPSGSVFSAVVSTDDMTSGQFRVYDLSGSDCNNLWNNVYNGNFDPTHPSRSSFVNKSASAHTFAVAFYDAMPGQSGGSFHVQYSIVQPSCGDGYVDQQGELGPPEQCDDGNATSLDGCSSSCQVESGYQCSGGPSACFLPLAGDTCGTAQSLVTGNYSLTGFNAECGPMNCNVTDRWFSTTIMPGNLIVLKITPSQPGMYARLMNMTNGSCDMPPQVVAQAPLDPGQASTLTWRASAVPANVMLEVFDQMSNPSNASFDMNVHIGPPGCGDGYADTAGMYGPPEQCDDGNPLPNDGCSPTCTFN